MKKLLLVDGSNLLFQMFYGMPSRIINKEGKAIQGVLGFVGALRKMIAELQPTHLCVLFDGEHENPRNEIYKEYKSNRIDYSSMPLEETPFSQLPEIYKALTYLKISFKEITDYETDDYIATYVHTYQNDMNIVIASWDSDYFSLINEHVKIYRYRGKKSYMCDKQYIQEKLHIEPNQYIFYKSLVGDDADNIKGVPKIGPITAAKIVNLNSSRKELFAKLNSSSFKKILIGYEDLLALNEKLISFQKVKRLPYILEDLKYSFSNYSTSEVLQKINILI